MYHSSSIKEGLFKLIQVSNPYCLTELSIDAEWYVFYCIEYHPINKKSLNGPIKLCFGTICKNSLNTL
jgi:hypothetical protein